MSEMVERVARAINEKMREIDRGIPSWEEFSDEDRQAVYPVARSAIETMREPTDEMIKGAWGVTDEVFKDHEDVFRVAWRSMINEALK